jgi:catechol 2,3-dioxygenase-like lactoylglutathione lyase family enzyme
MTKQHPSDAIVEVGTVFVPVSDQARALSFYTETLGFEKRFELEYGGGKHWIEVAPPGGAHRIALVEDSEGSPRAGSHTHCAFLVPDTRATHAALKARGARVSEIATQGSQRTGLFDNTVVVKNPVPAQFYVHDPDGNRFLVVQTS